MAKILLLEPSWGGIGHDPQDLEYASCVAKEYADEYADELRNLGHEVIEIEEPYANEANIAIRQQNPDLVWWVGHGEMCITTLQEQDIWISNFNTDFCSLRGVCCQDFNLDILKDTIANALSCVTGKELGKKAVEHGCLAYLGYVDNFIFLGCETQPCPCANEPPEGELPELVRPEIFAKVIRCMHDSNFYFNYSLAQGKTTGEAFNDSIERFNYWINEFENTEPQNDTEAGLLNEAIFVLTHDRDNQALHGRTDIKLGEHPVKRCEDYTTQEECEAAGCYWYDNACHTFPQITIPKEWFIYGSFLLSFIGFVSTSKIR